MRDDYHELWYDCSHYEQYIDFGLVRAPNVIIKAGGSLEEDELFMTHALGANANKKRIFLYYWTDSTLNATDQAIHFISLKAKLNFWGIKVYGLMPDIEQWWSSWVLWKRYVGTENERLIPRQTDDVIAYNGYQMAKYLKDNAGVPVVVYTGLWFIETYSKKILLWINEFPVWLAEYITSGDKMEITWDMLAALQPPEDRLPRLTGIKRENLVLWQWTAEKFYLPGCYSVYPTRKKDIDISIYRGIKPVYEMFNYEGVYMSPTLYYPFDKGFPISQKFGVNPSSYQTTNGHNGIDWAIPVGHNIYAAQDGQVVTAVETTTGYGRHVRIQSTDGLTIYGHASKLLVKQGDVVKAKQVIALSGGALTDPFRGNSSGPHLHFEYRPNLKPTSGAPGTLGGAIDPMPYLVEDASAVGVLFKVQCLCATLRIHSTPDISSSANVVGGLGYNETRDVFEEQTGCYRISNTAPLWISSNPLYVKKLVIIVTPPEVPAPSTTILFNARCIAASLKVRSTPNLSVNDNVVGFILFGTVHDVYEINNGCYRISPTQQKWVSAGTAYMQKIVSPTPAPVPVPVPIPAPTPVPVPVPTTQPLSDWAKEVHVWATSKGFTGKGPA